MCIRDSFISFQNFKENSSPITEVLPPTSKLYPSAPVNVTKQGDWYILTNNILQFKINTISGEQQFKSLIDNLIFWDGISNEHAIEIIHYDGNVSGVKQDFTPVFSFSAVNGSNYAEILLEYSTSAGSEVTGINITCRYRMYSNDYGMEMNYTVETPPSLPAGKAIKKITGMGRLKIHQAILDTGNDGYIVLPLRSSGILIPLDYINQKITEDPIKGEYNALYPKDWTMQFLGIVYGPATLLF